MAQILIKSHLDIPRISQYGAASESETSSQLSIADPKLFVLDAFMDTSRRFRSICWYICQYICLYVCLYVRHLDTYYDTHFDTHLYTSSLMSLVDYLSLLDLYCHSFPFGKDKFVFHGCSILTFKQIELNSPSCSGFEANANTLITSVLRHARRQKHLLSSFFVYS